MSDTYRLLGKSQISSSVSSIYTNSANTITYIQMIIIHNTNTSSESTKIYRVANSGGSLGTALDIDILFNIVIPTNETIMIELPKGGLCLESTNDSLQAITTTSSKVNILIHGIKEV